MFDIKKEMLDMAVFESDPIDSYFGPFSFDIINEKLIFLKKYLEENEPDRKKFKRLYSVMVETLENVIKHSDKNEFTIDAAMLLYKKHEEYTIFVGNIVNEENATSLINRLESLKGKNNDELKLEKIKQLKEGQISEKGGAGLGLIELVIKTDHNITYKNKTLTNELQLFILIIKIK